MENGREPSRLKEGRRRVVREMRIERGSNGGIEYEEDSLKVRWCVCCSTYVRWKSEVGCNNTEELIQHTPVTRLDCQVSTHHNLSQ